MEYPVVATVAERPEPRCSTVMPIPGFAFDQSGKPQIGLDLASLYAYGHLIRGTEQLILDLFGRGLLSGTTHTCLGQELCQLTVVRALDHPDDVILSNHRNHGHFLTYSGDFLGLVAEVMGRDAGVCRGYGGSQHIAFRRFHSNGVQAGMTAIGVGQALSMRKRQSNGLVAICVGDGTLGEGLLYESMNLASVWAVPALFVVEHNGIAQTTDTSNTLGGSITGRGEAFGLPTWEVDDSDPEFAYRVDSIVREVRAKRRPSMLVVHTCRMGPHSKGDDLRDDGEKLRIRKRDPLAAIGKRLSDDAREAIERRNAAFLEEVEKEALASPESRFADRPKHALRPARGLSSKLQPPVAGSVRMAINAALRQLLDDNADVLLLGEDLHEPYGGAFKVAAGLSTLFPDRVLSTPISEAAITGAGIGLALAGRLPVVEIMFADFVTLCADQLYNHAVKFAGIFPDVEVPLVVRVPSGGRRGYGPTHSQSPENLLTSIPGLTVVFGSHRHNVGQLLVDAVLRWPNPTVFVEHKLLYAELQDPGEYTIVEPDARDCGAELFHTLRTGAIAPDVTIVCYGGMLPVAERVATRLGEEEELAVEIVVPSLLAPLPRRTLVGLLRERARVVVAEESQHEFGIGAEILASLAESGFRGAVARVGMAPVPIAAARSLERDQIPDERAILEAVASLL